MNQRGDLQHVLTLVLASALAWQPACSLLAVTPPPVGQPPSSVATASAPCTRRREAPLADTVAVVVFGSLGLLTTGLGLDWREKEGTTARPSWDPAPDYSSANQALTLGIGALILAGVTAASAVYGFSNVQECRARYPLPEMPTSRRWLPPSTQPLVVPVY